MGACEQLYLDLMKKCLFNLIYGDREVIAAVPMGGPKGAFIKMLDARGMQLVRRKEFDPQVRLSGKDWPLYGQTMLSIQRMDNLQACVEQVLADNVPGDLIETGVWRGGASIFMRAILKVYGDTERTVWVADSFEGLPPPDPAKYPEDTGDTHHTFSELAVSLEEVQANFARYDLLDSQVRFLKGWFKDTLPTAPIERLALMRLDGDMYESTMDALTNLYPKLSVGGYVLIDDYGHLEPCRQAVHDYRKQHGIEDEITMVDWTGAYWRRSK